MATMRVVRHTLMSISCCTAILLTRGAGAESSTRQPDGLTSNLLVQTSVCEILKSPQNFDGEVVQIRATVLAGFEVFALRDAVDENCGAIWLSYDGGGPTASLSLGLRAPTVERPPVTLQRNRQFKRFQELLKAHMYPRRRENVCVGCNRYEVTARLTGRLDVAGEGTGFGHMNAYGARLTLQSVTNISTLDLSSNYDLTVFSVTPIAFPSGRVRGKVIELTGKPVNNAEVTLRLVTDEWPFLRDLVEWADEGGRFSFDDVPPGTYLAGVNLDSPASDGVPFPATYFPGMLERDGAESLEINDGQRRRIVIRLGEELERWTIPVKVIWPDGKPVFEANVWLKEIRDPIPVVGGAVSLTDSNGLYDLVGLHGIDYVLQADIYQKPSYKPYCSEQIRLSAGTTIQTRIALVLAREGDVCRHEAVFGTPPTD